MTETPTEGDVILEPGDPGYVAPVDPPPAEPVVNEVPLEPGPPGADLTHTQAPGESDAAFAARTRGVVVDSQSPTDIVPNTPQTTLGPRVQVEGTDPPVYTSVPAETLEEPEVEQPSSPQEGETPTEEPAA